MLGSILSWKTYAEITSVSTFFSSKAYFCFHPSILMVEEAEATSSFPQSLFLFLFYEKCKIVRETYLGLRESSLISINFIRQFSYWAHPLNQHLTFQISGW